MSHNTSCEKRKNGRVALRSKAEDIFSRERKRPRKSPPCYANPYVLYHMYERSVMLMLFNIHNVICLVSIEGDAPGPIHERSTSNLLVVFVQADAMVWLGGNMACACTMVRRMRTAATQDDYTDSNFASQKTLVLPLTAHTYQARLVSARNACRDFRDRSAHFPNPPQPTLGWLVERFWCSNYLGRSLLLLALEYAGKTDHAWAMIKVG
ncbi:hypothetical protein COCSADRAFT_189058 [Bipolaris sorokiniana ND90Pr]|uniref:Uncharacterized protein n=1 Tax=Cochliobolus sativus (strain ND90Pr / ATCC 201652) TaxID=665912 RepID=M2SWW8_COCSN|nr:uncharacterized protein COCSADRAFT_189058 [Bipolaris sorokiniana ND90Pr]EMD66800.1 hypothetical protein COCSADRAFT_189058 [Bipolaris sorokiniana ND90Pr]